MEQFLIEQAKPEDAALLLDYMKAIGGETDNLSFGPEDIHINADGKTPHQAVVTALEAASNEGFSKITFAALKPIDKP